jgi:hypothetical protein
MSEARVEMILGYLEHVESGLFVHPLGGKGEVDKRLILHAPVREARLLFRLHPDGSLEHLESGLFVHPKGGTAVADVGGGAFVVLGGDGVGVRVGVCWYFCVRWGVGACGGVAWALLSSGGSGTVQIPCAAAHSVYFVLRCIAWCFDCTMYDAGASNPASRGPREAPAAEPCGRWLPSERRHWAVRASARRSGRDGRGPVVLPWCSSASAQPAVSVRFSLGALHICCGVCMGRCDPVAPQAMCLHPSLLPHTSTHAFPHSLRQPPYRPSPAHTHTTRPASGLVTVHCNERGMVAILPLRCCCYRDILSGYVRSGTCSST